MDTPATPPGDPAPAPADPGTAPSGPAQPTGPAQTPGAPAEPPAETPPAQQPGTGTPDAPPAPAQADAQAPDAAEPGTPVGTQESPLVTAVSIDRISGTVTLDGVGIAEVEFDFGGGEGAACTVLLDGDPVEVDIAWPPEAPTHSSVQANLVNAAQQAAQKASAG